MRYTVDRVQSSWAAHHSVITAVHAASRDLSKAHMKHCLCSFIHSKPLVGLFLCASRPDSDALACLLALPFAQTSTHQAPGFYTKRRALFDCGLINRLIITSTLLSVPLDNPYCWASSFYYKLMNGNFGSSPRRGCQTKGSCLPSGKAGVNH